MADDTPKIGESNWSPHNRDSRSHRSLTIILSSENARHMF
jgi:hypothetical protein